MTLALHPNFSIQKVHFGNEKAPLIIVDNLIENAEQLVDIAASKAFIDGRRYYPGVRAKASLEYQKFILDTFGDELVDFFQLAGSALHFTMCHYSLVTQPAEKLQLLQRLPHVDSLNKNGLAAIHYLFKRNHGGTAFYRHRASGYEYIDESRERRYGEILAQQSDDPGFPGCRYINGDTAYYEQILAQEGVFNRMLIYRRNSLHSGSIAENFVPDSNPLTGRLSINSFIDIKK